MLRTSVLKVRLSLLLTMFIVFPELKPQFPSCLVIISSLNLVKELSLINIFTFNPKRAAD